MASSGVGFARLNPTAGVIRLDTTGTDEEDLDVDPYEELREQMADLTDGFLHQLYGHVVPVLAERFEDLMRVADDEVATLAELARSIGIDIATDELVAHDPAADRIAWHPVARSATLALVNWLIERASDAQLVVTADEWAEETGRALDYEVFRAKTALGEADARIALTAAAQAIVAWPPLTSPRVLTAGDRYLSLWADVTNGTIGGLVSSQQPLLYVPIGSEPAVEFEGDNLIRVVLDQSTADLVPMGATVDYSEVGEYLVISEAVDAGEEVLLEAGFALNPEGDWSYAPRRHALHVTASGPLSFSVPRTAGVHVVEGGLLIERDIAKYVSLGRGSEAGEIVISESDTGDAKPIARYVRE